MRHLLLGFVLAACASLAVSAQTREVERETKIEVKDGKDVKLTGCLERHHDSMGATKFRLTNVADKDGRRGSYLLVDEEDDLEDHVGHLVEIEGTAADAEDGHLAVETKEKIERDDADDTRAETKQEVKGDLRGIPILDVDEVKMLRPTCK